MKPYTFSRIFHDLVKNQFHISIQILKTDNTRHFFNLNINLYLQSLGVVHQISCVDTPQQNETAERKNRHILEVARSLLFQTNIPKKFWGEAVLTTTYLINRLPSCILKFNTLIQSFQKHFPTSKLAVFHQKCLNALHLFMFIPSNGESLIHVHLNVYLLDTRLHKRGISISLHPSKIADQE